MFCVCSSLSSVRKTQIYKLMTVVFKILCFGYERTYVLDCIRSYIAGRARPGRIYALQWRLCDISSVSIICTPSTVGVDVLSAAFFATSLYYRIGDGSGAFRGIPRRPSLAFQQRQQFYVRQTRLGRLVYNSFSPVDFSLGMQILCYIGRYLVVIDIHI